MPPLPESEAMKTIMVAALLCTTMLDASPAVSLPLVSTPEEPEALRSAKSSRQRTRAFSRRQERPNSGFTLDLLGSLSCDADARAVARNPQVFRLFSVRLRRTKDCAEDDNRVLGP